MDCAYLNYSLKTKSLEICYWMGFLAADGCVSIRRDCKGIAFNLHSQDKIQLRKFLIAIRQTNRRIGTNKQINQVKLWVGIDNITLNLLRYIYNVTPRKTYNLKPPNLDTKEQQLAYIAGFIDGDGCMMIDKNKTPILHIGSASKEILNWIKQFFDTYYPKTTCTGKVCQVNKQKTDSEADFWQYRPTGCRLNQFILDSDNILSSTLMRRKWNKMISFAKKEVLIDRKQALTDNQLLQLRTLFANNYPNKEIVQITGLPLHTVEKVKYGRSYINQGQEVKVKNPKYSKKRFMSKEEVVEIQNLLGKGLSMREISRRVGRGRTSIKNVKLGKHPHLQQVNKM